MRRRSGGDDGVPESGAVEVKDEAIGVRPGADGLNLLQRINAAAAAIVCVFQADQARPYQVIVAGPNLVRKLTDIQDAIVAIERTAGDAAKSSGAAGFVVVDVAIDVAEQFIARLRVDLYANLVGHAARRHEQSGFLAEKARHALF